MSTESFESRVRELVEQGKLSPEEARGLLGEPAPRPETTAASPQAAPEVAPDAAPLRLIVDLTRGDVTVRGRSGVTVPRLVRANRYVALKPTAAGWAIEHRPVADLSSALDWVRAGLQSLSPGDVELEVPEGLEQLTVNTLAGHVEVRDVRAPVRVSVTAGDVDLEGVTGFDVTARTGSVTVRGTITEGRHRVNALTGDVELVLSASSSAQVQLSTVTGRVDARTTTVGAGAATIELATVTGDLDVRTGREA